MAEKKFYYVGKNYADVEVTLKNGRSMYFNCDSAHDESADYEDDADGWIGCICLNQYEKPGGWVVVDLLSNYGGCTLGQIRINQILSIREY
ncbi:MAG: hypothetical protein IKP73_05770 [Bacteroidales bacterium]|nr:hypothetical protein [Bacteroidales bacterium]MBR6176848.1 hypothetical protein [Bacteroidales bacterium]